MRSHKMKLCAILLSTLLTVGSIAACGTTTSTESATTENTTETTTSEDTATSDSTASADYEYSSEDIDASYDEASATKITLDGTTAQVDGDGASVSGSTITISEAGTYILSGTLSDGQVIVSADKEDTVRLVLNGVDISSSTSSAIYAEQSEKVIIILPDGTKNTISDATTYVYEDESETEPDAAIFSKDDLIFTGTGELTVSANYNNGIQSKDNLLIASGTYNITAVNNAIHGKDSLTILDGTYTIDAEHNALNSKSNLTIEGGTYYLKAVKKGIHADQLVTINAGTINVEESYEGIEGLSITINGGDINIVASDDGMNAANQDDTTTDTTTMEPPTDMGTGDNGQMTPPTNDETATQSTDNATSDNAGTATNEASTSTDTQADASNSGNQPQMPQGGGDMGGGMDEADEDCIITITGGTITINAEGDGIDSNGYIYMSGGEVYVNGPTSSGDGALDYDGDFIMSGGILVAIGSAGMAQSISDTSTQHAVEIIYTSSQSAGSVVTLLDSSGNEVLSYTSVKNYQSIVISTPDLKDGETYTLLSDQTTLGEITLSGVSTIVDETGETTTANTMGPGGGFGGPDQDQMPQGGGQMPDQTEGDTTKTE